MVAPKDATPLKSSQYLWPAWQQQREIPDKMSLNCSIWLHNIPDCVCGLISGCWDEGPQSHPCLITCSCGCSRPAREGGAIPYEVRIFFIFLYLTNVISKVWLPRGQREHHSSSYVWCRVQGGGGKGCPWLSGHWFVWPWHNLFFLLLNIFSAVLCGSECYWKSGHRYSLQHVDSPLWRQGYRRTRSKN